MTPSTVWFNKGFSSLYSVIDLIKQEDGGERYRLLCSHSNAEFMGFLASDISEVEPSLLKDSEYLDYCLDVCARHAVKIFIPARRLQYLVQYRDRFAARGVRLLAAADAETLKLIDNKAALYDRLRDTGIVPVPEYHVVNDVPGYDAAVAQLWDHHGIACIKPSVSVFGLGFRILTRKGRELDRLLNGEVLKIGVDYFRALLAEAGTFRELMVMQYLEGRERSIDCLADNGRLLVCIVRRKSQREGGSQLIEDHPEMTRIAAELTRVLHLDGIFNIQLKESKGVPYLLEINPRMSGGLPFACLAGTNIPYWALRVAEGSCRPAEIPQPCTGIRVGQVTQGVVTRGQVAHGMLAGV